MLVGNVEEERDADGVRTLFVRVERAIPDWSIPGGSRLQVGMGFLGKGRLLRPRLRAEAARRGQPVPKVRFGRS